MRKILIIIAFVLPVMLLQAQNTKNPSASKSHKKEIPASKLPDNVTSYIATNLPNARITKVTKQKRNPGATYIVAISIKTKHHTLVFNNAGDLVKLNGKKLESTAVKK
jgi:hypothetical protein